MNNTFGEFVKATRVARRITLRAFSQAVGLDPANYSRIERGMAPPPASEERLRGMAHALGIGADTEEFRDMRRLAAVGRGQIPPAALSDAAVVAKLPILFRTLEGDKVDDEMLDDLFEALRKG
jgi:transcriptional regulator with XRE-family HTH domain